DLKVATD
ncbi:Late transcription factor VLTF-4 (1), partial [Monkeypox virus]